AGPRWSAPPPPGDHAGRAGEQENGSAGDEGQARGRVVVGQRLGRGRAESRGRHRGRRRGSLVRTSLLVRVLALLVLAPLVPLVALVLRLGAGLVRRALP